VCGRKLGERICGGKRHSARRRFKAPGGTSVCSSGDGHAAIFTLVVANHCVVATFDPDSDPDPDLDETAKP